MKKGWAIIGVLTVAAALFFYQTVQTPDVTMAEAGEQLAERYSGTLIKSAEQNGQYVYTIKVAEGEYEMIVDSETGELQEMSRMSESLGGSEAKQTIEEQDTLREETAPVKKSGPLTEAEAGEIALREVPGTIEEIEMGDDQEAGTFIVDIDLANGDEATVQVNAISGEIMSISWDD